MGIRVQNPKIRITKQARVELERYLSGLRAEEYAVTLVWSSDSEIDSWHWEVGFHASQKLKHEHRFIVDGIPFYFDGPYYRDHRSVEGKAIDFRNNEFVVE